MFYEPPVYRPPSEASSLILQITIGCSHNGCTFCSMYKGKSFRIKSWEEIQKDILECGKQPEGIRRIFLADGNALAINTDILVKTLILLYKTFPDLKRVGIYAGPRDILSKPESDLEKLKAAGLSICYLGIESGSDIILKSINKGVNSNQMIEAGKKIMNGNLKLSATIILGLGGHNLWEEHAVKTASVVSAINPTYLGALTLMLEPSAPLYKKVKSGKFKMLDSDSILKELKLLLENVQLKNCIFRSNHASNYLPLGGTLNRDREKLINTINNALERPTNSYLRPEFLRRL